VKPAKLPVLRTLCGIKPTFKMNKFFIGLLLSLNICVSHSQDIDIENFNSELKSAIKELKLHKAIEYHLDSGYILSLKETKYFFEGLQMSTRKIYNSSVATNSGSVRDNIKLYFEQLKDLKSSQEELFKKMEKFDLIKSNLKIRLYSDRLKDYYKSSVIRDFIPGIFMSVVFDLDEGVGSVETRFLDVWGITRDSLFLIAEENTIKDHKSNFIKVPVDEIPIEFYLLTDEYNLYVTTSLLKIEEFNLPEGKYGTVISVPNSSTVIASPINKKSVKEDLIPFMQVTNNLYLTDESIMFTNHIFWYYNGDYYLIKKDIENKVFILPEKLEELIK
jgi:hypothetical protein